MGIREETEKRVFAYIEEYGMISPGDKIVAGVSGGADSMCLFRLLLAYRERVAFALAVAHVNHGLRRDAEEDARYVEELCGQEGIPFFLTESDVHRVAALENCSEEDAGRRIRYRAFREAAGKMGAGKVAVAHNSDDNAETMLFHLFRGSGLQGISGIAPLRPDEGGLWILRPILCLERREVEAYLRELGISWRRDSTNEGDGYSRNRIRHHILPYAGQEVSGAVGHMLRTARLLQEAEGYLRQQTREALEQCAASDGEGRYLVMRPPFSVSTMPCGGGCCWSCWGTCRLRGRISCPYMSGTLWPCSREKGTDISPCLLASRPGGSTVRWCWSAWRRRSGQERPRPGMYSRPGGRSPRRCF